MVFNSQNVEMTFGTNLKFNKKEIILKNGTSTMMASIEQIPGQDFPCRGTRDRDTEVRRQNHSSTSLALAQNWSVLQFLEWAVNANTH